MPTITRNIISLLIFTCLILSCNSKPKDKGQSREWFNSILLNNRVEELTPVQQSAFGAMTRLQVSSDKKNRLFSTYAGVYHPCYPADTSFLISQSELLAAMMVFGKKNYTRMDIAERDSLINAAVLLKEDYTVLHCHEDATYIDYDNGPPMVGRWIMPSVLGRTDIVLVWQTDSVTTATLPILDQH